MIPSGKNSSKPIFFHPEIAEIVALNEEESFHAIRVLRLKIGDKINLINGKGNIFNGEIIESNHNKCKVKVIDLNSPNKTPRFKSFSLHIAVAPTKRPERFEWFLEKVTEIGVDEITPLICDHSERKTINYSRHQKILISAIKQSGNLFLPKFNPPEIFSDFIKNSHGLSQKINPQKFIAHYSKNHLKNLYSPGNDALVIIGPEGDFSERELLLAKEMGYAEVSLGNNRLRTETAALAACYTINLTNEI